MTHFKPGGVVRCIDARENSDIKTGVYTAKGIVNEVLWLLQLEFGKGKYIFLITPGGLN